MFFLDKSIKLTLNIVSEIITGYIWHDCKLKIILMVNMYFIIYLYYSALTITLIIQLIKYILKF